MRLGSLLALCFSLVPINIANSETVLAAQDLGQKQVLPVNKFEYERALRVVGIDPEKHMKIKFVQVTEVSPQSNSAEVKYRSLDEIFAIQALTSDMIELIKGNPEAVKNLRAKYILDDSTEQKIGEMIAKLYLHSKLSSEDKVELKTAFEAKIYSEVAMQTLIWLIFHAPHKEDRLSATSAFIQTLAEIHFAKISQLALILLNENLLDCDAFTECFDLLSHLAEFSTAAPKAFLSNEYLPKLKAKIAELVAQDPFLGQMLQYRLSVLQSLAKLFAYTDLPNQSSDTKLSLDQYYEIVGEMDSNVLGRDINLTLSTLFGSAVLDQSFDPSKEPVESEAAVDTLRRKAIHDLIELFEHNIAVIGEGSGDLPSFWKMVSAAVNNVKQSIELSPGGADRWESSVKKLVEQNDRKLLLSPEASQGASTPVYRENHDALDFVNETPSVFGTPHSLLRRELMLHLVGPVLGVSNRKNSQTGKYINKYTEDGFLNPLWSERTNNILKTLNDEKKSELLRTTDEVISGLFFSYYSAIGLRYYLDRFDPRINTEKLLTAVTEIVNSDDYFEQGLYDPVALYLMLNQNVRYEMRFAHRKQWRDLAHLAANKLIQQMQKRVIDDRGLVFDKAASPRDISLEFFTPEGIQAQMQAVDQWFAAYDTAIRSFLDEFNMLALSGREAGIGKSSYYDIERWLARNIPGFNSLYEQMVELKSAYYPFIIELTKAREIKGQETRDKFVKENVLPLQRVYNHKLLTLACYGYWYPVNREEALMDHVELRKISTAEMMKQKPAWQVKYNMKNGEYFPADIDLSRACGSNPAEVPEGVRAFLTYEETKHQTDNPILNGAQWLVGVAADPLMMLSGLKAVSMVSFPIHKFGINRVAKGVYLLRKGSKSWATTRALAYGSHLTVTSAINLSILTVVHKGMSASIHAINDWSGGALSWIPSEPFIRPEEDPADPQGLVYRVYQSFVPGLAMGLPVIMILPGLNVIAKRQIYTRDVFGRQSRLKDKYINAYTESRGLHKFAPVEEGRTLYVKKVNAQGWTEGERIGYVLLPAVYTTGAFVAAQYGARAANKYIWGWEDPVFGGWATLGADVLHAAFYTGIFTAMHIRADKKKWMENQSEAFKRVLEPLDKLHTPLEIRIKRSQGDSYYDLLGVKREPELTQKMLDKAHGEALKKPNAGVNFAKINEAYRTLKDPQLRIEYDKSLDHILTQRPLLRNELITRQKIEKAGIDLNTLKPADKLDVIFFPQRLQALRNQNASVVVKHPGVSNNPVPSEYTNYYNIRELEAAKARGDREKVERLLIEGHNGAIERGEALFDGTGYREMRALYLEGL